MSDHALLERILESINVLKVDQGSLLNKVELYQAENREEIRKLNDKMNSHQYDSHSDGRKASKVYSGASDSEDAEPDVFTVPVGNPNTRRSIYSTSPSSNTPIYSTSPGSVSGIPMSPNSTSSSKSLHRSHNPAQSAIYNHRIILTTYPGQLGVNPIPLNWGHPVATVRGPVVASRNPNSLKVRNAIGAHGGSYCIYRALAVAIGDLEPGHRPNLTNTEPVWKIGPHPQWGDPEKIVSIDPWGGIITDAYKKELSDGLDVRPTIAITKAHMKVPEIEKLCNEGKLDIDGKVVVSKDGELVVTKAAVEPVWYLPGVAKRFGVDETSLRRCLFEDTGGMYPELITRPDLKVFLPPIGGLTVYIFGNPDFISDPTKKLTLRIHDECNGSDVFGSDICTCRPYLIFGIEECVKAAQRGGVGVVAYFRKEGRALGEVTKYLVYNARKRQEGGDTAANYFLRTQCIAGVKDMRFQALMPDVLHWMGITKVDYMISMSNMKYEAIVQSGIPIHNRVPIPEEMVPPDSQVEMDAKIAAGYFSDKKVVHGEDLDRTKGRAW